MLHITLVVKHIDKYLTQWHESPQVSTRLFGGSINVLHVSHQQ
jgi:hypothetical protein